jgi:hypothetical protein
MSCEITTLVTPCFSRVFTINSSTGRVHGDAAGHIRLEARLMSSDQSDDDIRRAFGLEHIDQHPPLVLDALEVTPLRQGHRACFTYAPSTKGISAMTLAVANASPLDCLPRVPHESEARGGPCVWSATL